MTGPGEQLTLDLGPDDEAAVTEPAAAPAAGPAEGPASAPAVVAAGGPPAGEGSPAGAASPVLPARLPAPGERSARFVARLLDRPRPTGEQTAVIEAAPGDPLLVVAGAGSGKTETMAGRVVHLVANEILPPERILGLTFTRKAATELGERIRVRLNSLRRKGIGGHDEEPVSVWTYHAYAAALVADHGLRLGIDTDTRLLGDAGAWQLVADLVEGWDGDMSDVDSAMGTVVAAVLGLAGECSEHLISTGQVDAVLGEVIDHVARLPATPGAAAPGAPSRDVREVLGRVAARRQLLPIVEAYLRRKRENGWLDFGDQVALAARLAAEVPEVAAAERERFGAVLLDEFQDTSHAQLVLLRSLFGRGHPVTAVGDPHQSIYGWRGASAGNLQRFPVDFPRADGAVADTCHLSTSWRNDQGVLIAANRVAEPLRTAPDWVDPGSPMAQVRVPALEARPGVGAGLVNAVWHATVEDEAAGVADAMESAWRAGRSAAVLCRVRSQFPLVEAALRGRGLPVEVVGLGGLLHVPEVADLRAALEVLHDPSRGDSLMRLLTGAAQRIGAADLNALGVWARRLAAGGSARERGRSLPAHAALDQVDEISLVEALDALPAQDWDDPAGRLISPVGRDRLARLAVLLRQLRRRTSLALPDLVAEVQRALLLDIEVAAVPGRSPAAARANLDAFIDVAASFAERSGPGLGAFLAWLDAAEEEERGLEAPVAAVRADAVQILTVHAARGWSGTSSRCPD